MADYKCFECRKEFSTEKSIISHMKTDHFHKNNAQQMKCIINHKENNACGKTFLTFGGLRKHIKICIKNRKQDVSVICDTEHSLNNNSVEFSFEVDTLLESFVEDFNIHEQVHPIFHAFQAKMCRAINL